MPFFEAAREPEVSGGTFLDVKGDMNKHKHDNYSIQMSGKDNVVTQINRPAMINNGEGGQVTIHIHPNCQQHYLGFHGNAYAGCPMFPCPHSDHPIPLQQPTFPSTDSTGSFYAAPSSSSVTMPTPLLPFNTLPMENVTQNFLPIRMPVPTKAPTLQGMGIPSAPQDGIPTSPATPPYQNPSQGTAFDQPGFFRPAFRLSIHNACPETHWSSSSDQLQSPEHGNSTISSPRSANSAFVPHPPSPPSPPQSRGPRSPVNGRNSKPVTNMRPPSRSYSESYLLTSQHDNAPNLINQNVGRLPVIPEHRWTILSTPEEEFRGGRENGSFFDPIPFPVEPSQGKGTSQEGASGFDIIQPKERKKNVRSMTEMIMPNPWD